MDPDPNRPGSSMAENFAPSIPPSPRPSMTSITRLSQSPQPQKAADIAPSPVISSQPPPFSSLFAIVSTANMRTSHHPTMHYIFADDDPEILTAALAHHHRDADDPCNDDQDQDDDSGTCTRNQQLSGDHAIVLDVTPSPEHEAGFEVAWASSLTPDWAVLSARIHRMEGDVAGRRSDGSEALMLRVEGERAEDASAALPDGDALSLGGSGSGSGSRPRPPQMVDYAAMLQDFEKRMSVLRRVVEAGEERQRAISADDMPEERPGFTTLGPSGEVHEHGGFQKGSGE